MVEFGFDPVISSGLNKPTSLQFGVAPGDENRLYVSEQKGLIKVYDVTSVVVDVLDENENVIGQTLDYSATLVETIDLINDIPNFNDDGSLASNQVRQVTGILVGEEDGEPVVYVSSSDPRIGGGSVFDDKNVDTNSGVLSKLTLNDQGEWEKVDLIRGLPRSEENHSVNGMAFTPDGNLLLTVGGFTNSGAPSANLVYTPEYFLSAAILEIDVAAIEAMPVTTPGAGDIFEDNPYIYDMPTLDIKERGDDHPFGGDNGFNQAYLELGGPIEIYATGFRNQYDIWVVEDASAPEGFRVYTWDNGPNNGWGGPAVDADGVPLTNADGTAPNPAAGPATNHPNEQNSNPLPVSQDQLILVERGGYYGHPTPARANLYTALYESPADGGTFGKAYDEFIVDDMGDSDPYNDVLLGLADFLPKDGNGDPIDPLNGYVVDPNEGVYLKPQLGGGSVDGTLVLSNASTNGIFVYQYEEGTDPELMDLDGDLFAAAFDEQILRVEFDETGTIALNRDAIEADEAWQTSPGNNPLDLIQGPNGSIWVAAHGGNSVFAYVPGGVPTEFSDNIDEDDLTNNLDPFGYDAENGKGTNSQVAADDRIVYEFNNSLGTPNGLEGWTLGLTGHMANYVDDHFKDVVKLSGVLDGGIAGRLQIEFDAVGSGSPIGAANDASYFLQTGVTPAADADEFIVESTMLNPWAISGGVENGDSLGIHFGSGTQFDFVYLAAEIDDNGVGQISMTIELNDVVYHQSTYAAVGLTDVAVNSTLTLRAHVDVVNGTVTPVWSYETQDAEGGADGAVHGVGQTVSLDDDNDGGTMNVLEEVISGQYVVRGAPSGGVPGDPIYGPTFQGIPSALAIGVGGIRGSTDATPPTSFAPEFDDLVFATSATDGNFDPIANEDGFGGAVVGEAFLIDVADLLANDVDYDIGDTLSVTGVSNPSGGTVSLNGGVVTFTPTQAGSNDFEYTLSDGTVSVTGHVIVSTTGGEQTREVVYRINAGGPEVAAIDGGPNWEKSNKSDPSPYMTGEVQAGTSSDPSIDLSLVDATRLPEQLFEKDHWDKTSTPEQLTWSFPVEVGETYEINLYTTENSSDKFDREFSVAVEGAVPTEFTSILPYAEGGDASRVASVRTYTYTATDNALDLEFISLVKQAQVHAIEIFKITGGAAAGPVVSLGADQTEVESGGQMSFALTLDDDALNTGGVDVTLRIIDGAAVAGTDYTVPNSTVDGNDLLTTITIPAGQGSGALLVDLIDIPGEQPSRDFSVQIESVSGSNATIDLGNDDALGTITDDDAPAAGPVVSLGADQTEVESGGQMSFALTLDDDALNTGGVDVTLRIIDGAAVAGTDYTVPNSTVDGNDLLTTITIPAGQGSGALLVDLIDIPGEQPSRDFSVQIESVSGSNATVDAANDDATGTITDDDGSSEDTIVYRFNAGGPTVAAIDGGPDWLESSKDNPSIYSVGEHLTGNSSGLVVDLSNVDASVAPAALFQSDQWDKKGTAETMAWAFPVLAGGTYQINLYFAENKSKFDDVTIRRFDFSVEGTVPAEFDDINPYVDGGGQLGGASMRSATVTMSADDTTLDLASVVDKRHPMLNAIEIIQIGDGGGDPPTPGADALDDPLVAVAGAPITLDALANDVTGASLVSVGAAGQGSTAIQDGLLVYTPTPGALGTDSFEYTIDVDGVQSTATVTVDVLAPVGSIILADGGAGDVDGTSASETIIGMGVNEKLKGYNGDDLLLGAGGEDTLVGASGDDSMFGGAGDDVVRGGTGADLLNGGIGDDYLIGGSDADIFQFTPDLADGPGNDTVDGFSLGADKIAVGSFFGSQAAALAAVSAAGADALLTLNATSSVLILGVDAGDLSENDFLVSL